MDIGLINKHFIEKFNSVPLLVKAPGRINLIGEHTDYNDGFVLPAAIDRSIHFAINLNNKGLYRFHSLDFDQYFETDHIPKSGIKFPWSAYLLGVLDQFIEKNPESPGVDCVFGGNIPLGAGLSSSAALASGFAYGVNKLLRTDFTRYELALMAQKAEHNFAGVNCGLMDQFASLFGKENHAIQLDCRTHQHAYFPIELEDHTIILCDTQLKHQLASSEYNLRREECETGVATIRKTYGEVNALRDVDLKMMKHLQEQFDPVVYKRCTYVIEENERVAKACIALKQKDYVKFGELMYASHAGLQSKYEVSCHELDVLVDLTRNLDYVCGSRMMGGGFGGCTINLVQKNYEGDFIDQIKSGYKAKTGKETVLFGINISEGVKLVNAV